MAPPTLPGDFPPSLVAGKVDPTSDNQKVQWAALTGRFDQARMTRHQWAWTKGKWVPEYDYQPVAQISDVWTEWHTGLNGYLAVRELTEGWSPMARQQACQKD